jgi:hypothetical protein
LISSLPPLLETFGEGRGNGGKEKEKIASSSNLSSPIFQPKEEEETGESKQDQAENLFNIVCCFLSLVGMGLGSNRALYI